MKEEPQYEDSFRNYRVISSKQKWKLRNSRDSNGLEHPV